MSSPDAVSENMILLARLYELKSILINMEENLRLIQAGAQGKIVTLSNANLYQLAAENYGDATEWTAIAEANGLTTPFVRGGFISSVIVTAGGSGYVRPVVVAIGNETYKANFKANVTDGVITEILVVTQGLYTDLPVLVITDSAGTGASAIPICARSLTIPQTAKNNGGVLII